MFCPRCVSRTRVWNTSLPLRICDLLPSPNQDFLIVRRRVCLNKRCQHRWVTYEISRGEIQAILSDVARVATTLALEMR